MNSYHLQKFDLHRYYPFPLTELPKDYLYKTCSKAIEIQNVMGFASNNSHEPILGAQMGSDLLNH